MEAKWLSNNFDYEKIILSGDLGGTNANLALVGKSEGKYTIIVEYIYKSNNINDIIEPINEVLQLSKDKSSNLIPDLCCISAAGPVDNNYCQLTNCDWNVDGEKIQSAIGIKTLVINDFLAIGYGIPTLDVNNPDQITKIPTSDGSYPVPQGVIKAVVGAGTGLGVGYLNAVSGIYRANSSEGGHSGYESFDEETRKLKEYITNKIGKSPGTELFVSGQGIVNIYYYLKEKENIEITGILKEIDEAPDEGKPAIISKHARENEICMNIMKLFVKMYARFASNLSLIFLPFAGMYLAGGIVTKNEWLFLEDNLFIKNFEKNYNPNIRPLLKKIPVYIIKDYSISLFGAANAAVTLME